MLRSMLRIKILLNIDLLYSNKTKLMKKLFIFETIIVVFAMYIKYSYIYYIITFPYKLTDINFNALSNKIHDKSDIIICFNL